MKEIKVFEMFAGFGGASFGLKKAGIPHQVIGYSEIDKFAVKCWKQNHGEDIKNYGDAKKINEKELPDFDLLTGGFPCQSFSVAGKGLGELDTRGTLFNEIIRIAEHKKPKYMILENVKGLLSKRHKDTFEKILSELKKIGYHVVYDVLNSKNYNIPQNRERVWFVCFRDINEFFKFKFPNKEELKIFLKDILEDEVDEKYYLKEEQVCRLIDRTMVKIPHLEEPEIFDVYNKKIKTDRISPTLTEPHHNNLRLVANINPSGKGMNGNVYSGNISPTITTNKGEGQKIIQLNSPKHSSNRVYSTNGISPTLNTMQGGNLQPFIQIKNFTVRKLTPTECFRLMGFLTDGINLDGLSNSQRYKLAGNGWDINLTSKIFKNLLK